MWRQVTALISAIYAWLIDVGNPLETCTLHLYSNTIDWTNPVVIGDLTEVAFTGYAAAAVVYAEATDSGGNPYLGHAPSVFTATAATGLPITIQGAYVTTAAGLQFGGAFANPLVLSKNGQTLHAMLPYQLPPNVTVQAEGFIM